MLSKYLHNAGYAVLGNQSFFRGSIPRTFLELWLTHYIVLPTFQKSDDATASRAERQKQTKWISIHSFNFNNLFHFINTQQIETFLCFQFINKGPKCNSREWLSAKHRVVNFQSWWPAGKECSHSDTGRYSDWKHRDFICWTDHHRYGYRIFKWKHCIHYYHWWWRYVISGFPILLPVTWYWNALSRNEWFQNRMAVGSIPTRGACAAFFAIVPG